MDDLEEDAPLLLGSNYTRSHSINSDGNDQQVSEAEDQVKFYKKRLSERFYGTVDSGYSNDESYFQPYSLSCFSFRRKSLKKYARDLVRWILSRQEQWTGELRKANTGFLYPIDIRHPRTSAPPLAKRPSYIPKKVADLSRLDWLTLPAKTGLEKCCLPAVSVQSNPDTWENVQLVVHAMEGGNAQVTGTTVGSLIPQGPGISSVATFTDISIRRAGNYIIEVRSVLRPDISIIAPRPIVIEPNLQSKEARNSHSKHISEENFVLFGPPIELWTSAETFFY